MGVRAKILDNAAQMEKYFIKGKGLEAYYCDNQEFGGYWHGQGAKALGLEGFMTDEAFSRLCHNLHPQTGEKLTPRMRADRRPGMDIVWDVPKSVSIVYARSKDDRIIKAVRQAVHDTANDVEKLAATRVRAGLDNSADGNRTTGNWCAAELVHLTARPENGYSDMHVHVHLVVFNVTMDPVEKRWKAIQMVDIMNEMPKHQAAFHMRLSENLRALGLNIVPSEHGFEIEGIPHDLNEKFSRRTKTIEATAERLGITDPAQKAKLGAMTREKKNKDLLMSDLEPFWWSGLSPEHERVLDGVVAVLKRSRAEELAAEMTVGMVGIEKTSEALGLGQEVKATSPPRRQSMNQRTRPGETVEKDVTVSNYDRQAVALAMKHLFERQSVVTESELLTEAYSTWLIGKATLKGIQKAVAETPLLRTERGGKTYVTTAEVWTEEKRLYDSCRDGKGQYEPLNEFWKIEDEKLNAQQRAAVEHVLTSRDWVTGISGKAGSGKTRLLTEVRRGVEGGMYKVIALAPSARAARENLRNEGFKNAETVAKFLASGDMQAEAKGAVWLVDEAGMLPTPQTVELFQLAKNLGARLVLVGDIGQHHAVERGQAFDLLERYGDMSTMQVSEVVRQHGGYKRFVELIAAGKVREAFALPDIQPNIKEMPFEERMAALAEDYIATIGRGESALVVAPTHAECDAVTEVIRDKLKEKGVLGENTRWTVLRDQHWTEAERSDADHYQQKDGLIVQINGHVKGFALGEKLEVLPDRVKDMAPWEPEAQAEHDGAVRARSKERFHSRIKGLPLDQPKKFNVYERDEIEICAGEDIRITMNSRTADGHRVENGNTYKVDYIDPKGRLVLGNGWRLDRDFQHLEHAYTSTSHGAQGLTVDKVFVSQTARWSNLASDLKQFYVSISRGRDDFKLYADDLELLQENVSRVRHRLMATELLQGEQEEPVVVLEKTSALLGEQEDMKIEPTAEIEAELERTQDETEEQGMVQEQDEATAEVIKWEDGETISESFGKKNSNEVAAGMETELVRVECEQEERAMSRVQDECTAGVMESQDGRAASESLGQTNPDGVTVEMETELEQIQREKEEQEWEMRQAQEMVMGMGM